MRFTVMSYNVERGFHSLDHKLESERLEAAQQAIKEVNPDILALTEACYGTLNSQKILMDYPSLFEFPFYQFGGYPIFGPHRGDEGGNCLLSKIPMHSEAVQLPFKGAIRAKVPLDDITLTLDVIHPSYSVDDFEKIKTLRRLIEGRNNPYLLMGDFNTVHPEDEYDWSALKKDLEEFNPAKADQTIQNWRRAEFIKWLHRINLLDALPREKRESTVPTNYVYGKPKTGVRMDFIFKSPEMDVVDAYILKNNHTEIASDHYPVVGVFEI